MTKRIKILPSGHEFMSEGNSTLLEAGLGAGLALGYGCSNGNCGKCLAKIVNGEVRKTRHHDYVVNADGTTGHQVLMCCHTAVTDVILETPEAHGAGEIPQQHITARVKNIQVVNNNVALLHLKTPRSDRFRFLAGQHARLGGNGLSEASHSISSCPCDDMNLHFQIPRQPGNAFSEHVFDHLKKGDRIDLDGPGGDFILDEYSSRPLVFVAWRTGFGPVKSLVEQAMALELTETMKLLWIAFDKGDRYLDNLCRSWRDALDHFDYIPVDALPDSTSADIMKLLENHLDIDPYDQTGHDFYIAGNGELQDACGKLLGDNGVPANQIILDPLEHH